MKNLKLEDFGMEEISEMEMSDINGGGSGSANGAYIAGVCCSCAIVGPIGTAILLLMR